MAQLFFAPLSRLLSSSWQVARLRSPLPGGYDIPVPGFPPPPGVALQGPQGLQAAGAARTAGAAGAGVQSCAGVSTGVALNMTIDEAQQRLLNGNPRFRLWATIRNGGGGAGAFLAPMVACDGQTNGNRFHKYISKSFRRSKTSSGFCITKMQWNHKLQV